MNHRALLFNPLFGGARGGWDLSMVSRMFAYMSAVLPLIAIAGKALAGWQDPMAEVTNPTLVFLEGASDDLKHGIMMVMIDLYVSSCPELQPQGTLWRLTETLFAVEIMWLHQAFPKYRNDQGCKRFDIIFDAAVKYRVCTRQEVRAKFMSWSTAVYAKFVRDNRQAATEIARDQEAAITDLRHSISEHFTTQQRCI
jgi:hypothetical protein